MSANLDTMPHVILRQLVMYMPLDDAIHLGNASSRLKTICEDKIKHFTYAYDEGSLTVRRGFQYEPLPTRRPIRLILIGLRTLHLNGLDLNFKRLTKIELKDCVLSERDLKMLLHDDIDHLSLKRCKIQTPLQKILTLIPRATKFEFKGNNNNKPLPKNLANILRRWYKPNKLIKLHIGPVPLAVRSREFARAVFLKCSFIPDVTELGIYFVPLQSNYDEFFTDLVNYYLNSMV